MNWFTENKIFASLLVVITLAVLAFGYLTFAERGKYSDATEAYRSGMEKLADLRGRAPYRNADNLKKIQDQVGNYIELTHGLQADLIQHQGEIAAVEPAVFQGRLRESVSKTIEHATQRGVELPAKFYLGFEKYESELPRNDITGLLNWQLSAVEAVVNRLIDLKVSKITNVLRPTLPGELNPEPVSKEIPLLKKYPFEIVFLGYAGNVQSILNDLNNFPQFTIVRALRIENEQLKSPPRVEAPPSGEALPLGSDPTAAAAELAVDKIIIGKEKVTASMIIDLVQFTPQQTLKPTPKK